MTNRLSYTTYDFESLVAQLEARLKLTNTWKDAYLSSTGQTLIELHAAVANFILYSLERRAEESYIGTAKNLSSIVNLARLVNYSPKRKVSSTGTLVFSIPTALGKIIEIPRWTECQTAEGIKFITSESAAIQAAGTSVTINAIQGKLVTIDVTSPGSSNFSYTIEDADVENTNIFVYVDNILWTKVSSFINSTNTSQHYVIEQKLDNTLQIYFGNDINGKIPENGSTITIKYVKSDGSAGNVYSTSLITTINDIIYDSSNNTVSDLAVSNNSTFLGGDDAETLEELRYNAPRVFSTGDRAVTRDDYKAILLAYPGIASVNVWGEKEEYDDLGLDAPASAMNIVKLCIMLEDWQTLSGQTTFQNTLTNYLKDYAQLTVKYEYVIPKIVNIIAVFSEIKVVGGYSISQTQADVESALEALFELGDTVKIGTDKKFSNIVRTIDALDGVSYHHLSFEIKKVLSDTYDSIYDYGEILRADDVKKESVNVYVTDDGTDYLVATDDGLGGFTVSDSTYDISAGTINYATGEILLSFTALPSTVDAVYVRYQQDESNDITMDRDEIAYLYGVEVNSILIDE